MMNYDISYENLDNSEEAPIKIEASFLDEPEIAFELPVLNNPPAEMISKYSGVNHIEELTPRDTTCLG